MVTTNHINNSNNNSDKHGKSNDYLWGLAQEPQGSSIGFYFRSTVIKLCLF